MFERVFVMVMQTQLGLSCGFSDFEVVNMELKTSKLIVEQKQKIKVF